MVFVFFVQAGDMLTFDNEISIMQSVLDLKEKINEKCGIELKHQVLLINGGESLDNTKNLCSYMAGTDTNPIYLFSANYDISKIRILDNLNYDDSGLITNLTECCSLPVSLSTVKKRAQVAQDFYNVARKQLEFCENLVHDQHMQQQGWSAVIANLEDIVAEFKKRWEVFRKVYDEFIADKDTYDVIFQHFQEDKYVLQRIPILGTLLDTQKDLETSKNSETNIVTSQETENSTKEITLFEWISDNKSSLDNLYEVCRANLTKFETEVVPSLEKHVNETLQNAERVDKKEIEGLNKRLFDLQELIIKIKKYVEHQSDMSQSFQQNQQRASNLRDLSILPDLCATHLKQLEYIKEFHKKLMDDRNRIVRAKYELSKSLIARIGWVQEIESWLFSLDSHLVYYHEQLQRLRNQLLVFQQLHLAPSTYLNAVTEVVRRRNFSQMFLSWASELACNQLTIHNEEITRRKEFNSMFEGHFLRTLFPGLNDMPPAYATEAPAMFDAKLPKITEDDVERLRRELPDFADNLALPDTSTIVQFFMGKSSTKERDKVDDLNKAVEDKLIQAVSDVGLASNLDKNLLKGVGSESNLVTAHGLPHLKDIDRGCESETDTEEFEKVGQSPLELNFPQQSGGHSALKVASSIEEKVVIEKRDVSTCTEVLIIEMSLSIPQKNPSRYFQKSSITQTSQDLSFRIMSLSTVPSSTESFSNIRNISLDSIDDITSSKMELSDYGGELSPENESQIKSLGSRSGISVTKFESLPSELEISVKIELSDACSEFLAAKLKPSTAESKLFTSHFIKSQNASSSKPTTTSKIDLSLSKSELFSKSELSTSKLKSLSNSNDSPPTFPLTKGDQQQDFTTEEFYIDESLPSSIGVETTNNSQSSEFVRHLDTANVVVALLQENLEISRTEHEKIKSLFINMGSLAKQETSQLRTELNDLRAQVLINSTNFSQHCGSLSSSWDNLIIELDNQEKALIEKISIDHREEVLGMKKVERSKSEQIKSLEITKAKLEEWLDENTQEKTDLEQQIIDLKKCYNKDIEELNKLISEKDIEKERVLKEQAEILKLEHKAEIDSIKSRFRLMTMERSPSCNSLENKHSGDFISLPSHNATLLAQMAENFELDKESAVLKETQKWERILKEKIEEIEKRFCQERQFLELDVAKRVSEDKDKQIDLLTEKTNNLILECAKHKTTIQQLAEFTEEQGTAELMDQIDTLKKEKEVLQEELNRLKIDNQISSSLAMNESTKSDATTSPVREIPDLSKSTIAVSSSKILNLNIDSCKPGDTVMIIWDQKHENFKIIQESRHMYFLHSDCMEKLGLCVVEGKPNKIFCCGEVYDKEYCHARKSENRYKVAKGTKFFRVKVKCQGLPETSQSVYHPRPSTSHVQSSGMSQSQSSASAFEPLSEEQSVTSPTRSRLTSTQEEELPLDIEEELTLTLTDRLSILQKENIAQTETLQPEIELTAIQTPQQPAQTESLYESTQHLVQSIYEEPEVLRPHSVEAHSPENSADKHFAEDSGIEQSVEAIEHLVNVAASSAKSNANDDRSSPRSSNSYISACAEPLP